MKSLDSEEEKHLKERAKTILRSKEMKELKNELLSTVIDKKQRKICENDFDSNFIDSYSKTILKTIILCGRLK